MRDEVTAYVALGANLGKPAQAVCDALLLLEGLPQTRLVRHSSLFRSAPVDSSGPDYVNAVAELATRITAPELLDRLQAIEQAAGRERPFPNAPRTLDLDLLLFGSASIDSARLQVPHPRMTERAFVLVPLAEIAPHSVAVEQLDAVSHQRVDRLA
ncbi:MAG: 2-amino-4-hydroxy-6-hydroxymethyldihydropteridine diphosphokinase [Ramlibacter sp.]